MPEDIHHDRRAFLGTAAMTIAAAQLGMSGGLMPQLTHAEVPLPIEGQLPALGSVTEWLNSPPLEAAGLRGKVVLVQFCTYTCINWLRTLPYVRAWAEQY